LNNREGKWDQAKIQKLPEVVREETNSNNTSKRYQGECKYSWKLINDVLLIVDLLTHGGKNILCYTVLDV